MKKQKLTYVQVFLLLLIFLFSTIYSQQSDKRSKTFQVKKGGNLEVRVTGDILISSWDRSEVSVNVKGVSDKHLEDLTISQSGNTVNVNYDPDNGSSHVVFDIKIPEQYDADLHTSGGDIICNGTLTGTITGKTSGGDIKFGTIKGKVDVSTSGGDITVEDIQGNAKLNTSGGDIRLGMVSGEAKVTTSGGDIRVKNVGKSLEAHTSGGDLEIGDIGGEAELSTSGGDVKVGKVSGKATLSTSGGDIELKGSTGPVSAHTSGGDINIIDIYGSIDANTSGGDITAELHPDGKGSSKLYSSGGTIFLKLPENAKANIDARIRLHDWKRYKDEYDIRSDFKSETYVKDDDKREIRASYILNGGGENIKIETSGGNIEIRKLR
jgi:DUF4097 and DUF4098 domain-containing protein YvlB